jgi:hypothetical protein
MRDKIVLNKVFFVEFYEFKYTHHVSFSWFNEQEKELKVSLFGGMSGLITCIDFPSERNQPKQNECKLIRESEVHS